MELRHIRYFIALADQLSFTRAARQVHVTQSTLSHQIRQLEEEVGQRLFDRVGRQVAITAAGELLLPRAVKALGELDAGLAMLAMPEKVLSGRLRLGTTPTFNMNLIPRCLAEFRTQHPSVRTTIEQGTSESIVAGVRRGRLDVAIAYRPVDGTGLTFEPLCNEEMMLVVGKQHALANRRRLRVIQLHRQDIVVPPVRFATRLLLEEAFQAAGAEPNVLVETESIAAMLSIVQHAPVATILSTLAVEGQAGVSVVPLEDPTPMRTPGLVWNQGREARPVDTAFAAIVRNLTKALQGPAKRIR